MITSGRLLFVYSENVSMGFKSLFFYFRLLAHNGEINTIQGNIKNMTAREGHMHNEFFGSNLQK